MVNNADTALLNDEEERVVLTADVVVGTGDGGPESTMATRNWKKELHLCCLGCDDSPPYGPTQHTAQMFLHLLVSALQHEYPVPPDAATSSATDASHQLRIQISVYRCQQMDYPSDYSAFDGILLPGSFSGAYEMDEWIQRLKVEISTILYPQSIPTFGVCFGHQIYAHALGEGDQGGVAAGGGGNSGGRAIPCPAGPQIGCHKFNCTDLGIQFFMKEKEDHGAGGRASSLAEEVPSQVVELLYTHGDMVESLPWCAKSLGGNNQVPIQAAVYYSREDSYHNNDDDKKNPTIVAVTVQAHPEYAAVSDGGLSSSCCSLGYDEGTFHQTLSHMEQQQRGGTVVNIEEIVRKAEEKRETIAKQSIMVMIMAGKRLGWFA